MYVSSYLHLLHRLSSTSCDFFFQCSDLVYLLSNLFIFQFILRQGVLCIELGIFLPRHAESRENRCALHSEAVHVVVVLEAEPSALLVLSKGPATEISPQLNISFLCHFKRHFYFNF